MCLYLTIKGLPKKILCISYRNVYSRSFNNPTSKCHLSLLTSLLLPSITNDHVKVWLLLSTWFSLTLAAVAAAAASVHSNIVVMQSKSSFWNYKEPHG